MNLFVLDNTIAVYKKTANKLLQILYLSNLFILWN